MNFGINIPEYKVSHFNRLFKEVIEKNFDHVRIRGEISELKKAASGHLYLTLKDDNSVLNATIWNQKTIFLKTSWLSNIAVTSVHYVPSGHRINSKYF